MRPSPWLLLLLVIWCLVGLAGSIWPALASAWIWAGLGIGALSLVDMLGLASLKQVQVSRVLPSRCALDVASTVDLNLINPGRSTAWVRVFDGVPPDCSFEDMPWEGKVPGKQTLTLTWPITMQKRGNQVFGETHILRRSPFGLWFLSYRAGKEDSVKVYPNYEPVIRYSLLAINSRQDQMGIVFRNRQGLSREFHQLRDYQEGDILSQIDWKASSRRLQIISREYREQRNQNVVILLDSGRRMRAMDGSLPQFDHCLNAVLLMSFIALRQGDNVGVLGFGGVNRWLPPIKGQQNMTTILNHLYDYETSVSPSDFSEAAERILTHQQRRALVIVLTNLRSEDASDVVPALRTIQRRHLVMLVSLRENSVHEAIEKPVESFDDALMHGAANYYLEERKRIFRELGEHGIITVDEVALNLPVALTNAYLEAKRSGRL